MKVESIEADTQAHKKKPVPSKFSLDLVTFLSRKEINESTRAHTHTHTHTHRYIYTACAWVHIPTRGNRSPYDNPGGGGGGGGGVEKGRMTPGATAAEAGPRRHVLGQWERRRRRRRRAPNTHGLFPLPRGKDRD